ncbi:hypothetical protein [Fodinicola acaciae]|uniref:hypothetical protein n=1 Tax=Fodinicola acaciae TaxID=2681555 RepID=UPI0013D77225|nr:hypothetical protein [Fodinicola acaciae]
MDLVVALLVVAVLALILRWAYGSPRPKDSELADFLAEQQPLEFDDEPDSAVPPGRFGLLVSVARVGTEADGRALKSMLADAGIRATTSQDDGATVVLVFPADAPRARRLVGHGQV